MPEALSVKPEPYRHHWKPGDPYREIFTGWAYPPKDYQKWEELVYQWVKHCVDRYGKKEVETWYWEVWNEPNGYWKGSMQEFFKLYDYAADGVKRALPTAKIGGLDIAGTSGKSGRLWLNAFLKHCASDTNYATGKTGSPLDLVLFHAKGSPRLINGVVHMNMKPQLQDIAAGFETVGHYPQFKNLPLVVGESDPEGCAACGMATNPENAYRNGTMYSSYTAASFAREYELEDKYGINFLGSVSWSFEFENQPWFYGYRELATNGVDKPVLNVFRMLGKMGGDRVEVKSNRMYPLKMIMDSGVSGRATDIGALASSSDKSAAVMIWNYHDEDIQGAVEPVSLTIKGIAAEKVLVTQYRIDRDHSNSYQAWKKMGSPQNPTKKQIAELEKAGQLEIFGSPEKPEVSGGVLATTLNLPRQGVALIKLNWL
jgi:xylan 1,4-beta-xylosidase